MNREQIETTPAGPELDRLVAEAKDEAYPRGYAVPPWSTDIAAAWELVEEMITTDLEGWGDIAVSWNGYKWFADFYAGSLRPTEADGATAPEAITRAYLLAKQEAE